MSSGMPTGMAFILNTIRNNQTRNRRNKEISMNFQELVTQYLSSTEFQMLTDNTKSNYRSKLSRLVAMDGNYDKVIDLPVSNTTKNIYFSVLKSVFSWGEDHKLDFLYPVLPKKRLKCTQKDRKFFTKHEVETIWDGSTGYSDKIYANFLRMCFYTGCRPSELISLSWNDVASQYLNLRSTSVMR